MLKANAEIATAMLFRFMFLTVLTPWTWDGRFYRNNVLRPPQAKHENASYLERA